MEVVGIACVAIMVLGEGGAGTLCFGCYCKHFLLGGNAWGVSVCKRFTTWAILDFKAFLRSGQF